MAHNKHYSYPDEVHWSLVVEQDSTESPPENTGSSNPEFALPYRSTDAGAVKDHIGFISTSEEWRDQRLMNKLAAIRRLPSWYSPLPDPSTTEVAFKFKTVNGRYLEFLSLFLTGDRRVDIGFSRRHALICLLMRQLEESHFRYFRKKEPQEFEILQMTSADVFELHVWQAFLRGGWTRTRLSDYVVDEDGNRCSYVEDLDYLRQLAVHRTSTFRYSLSTSTIRSAAACALHLGDYTLLEQIELIVWVLYADGNDSLGFAITNEEQETVKNLLWPANRQITSVVQLLDAVQDLAERSSYDYCRRDLPQEVSAYRPTTHEHFELNWWHKILAKQQWSRAASEPDTICYDELKLKLSDCPVTDLRNAAAHRENAFRSAHGYCWEQKIVALIDVGLQYVQILGDKQATAAIEDLIFNVFPHLVQRREEWMGPTWCSAIDWAHRLEQLRSRSSYWAEQDGVYFQKNVDIRPISKWYMAVYERMYDVQVALGTIKVYQPSSEQSEAQEFIDEWSRESENPDREALPYEEASSQSWSPWEGDHDGNASDWTRALEMPADVEGDQLGWSDVSSTSADVDQAFEEEDDEMDGVRSVWDMISSDRDGSDLEYQQGFDGSVGSWGSDDTTLVNDVEIRDAASLLNENRYGAGLWIPDPDPQTDHGW
ncbi:MAG: hypothetical protein LQ350_001825 [Teloschistes chrysophthalmus]|nr:MAG: hypothetical protein LQ350_001825 [Niorma chrysophthalma]